MRATRTTLANGPAIEKNHKNRNRPTKRARNRSNRGAISRYHRGATLVQRRSCHFGRFAPSMWPVDAIQADAIQVDAAPTASMTAERLAAQGTKTRRLPRRGGSDDPYALRAARRLSQLRMTGIAGMRQYLASSGRSVSSSGKLASHSPWRRSRPAAANSSSARWLRASK